MYNSSYFFNTNLFDSLWESKVNSTKYNVIEKEDEYQLQVALPGISRDETDISLKVNKDILSIKTKNKKEEKSKINFIRKQFSPEEIDISFKLPDDTDSTKINSKYDNGILYVNLIKKEEFKEIEINVD